MSASTPVTSGSRAVPNTLGRLTRKSGDPQKKIIAGIQYDQYLYTNEPAGKAGMVTRVARGAMAVLGTGLSLGLLNVSKKFREETWETALKGEAVREALFNPVDPLEAKRMDGSIFDENSVGGLGYDPKKPATITDYLDSRNTNNKRAELIESYGHYVLPEYRRKGVSSFLFVPKNDFSQATSIKLFDAKTGKPLTGPDFHRAMHTFCAQYEEMTEALEKQADEIIAIIQKRDNEESEETLAAKKRAFLQTMRIVVLNHKKHHGRIFSKNDSRNLRKLSSAFAGTRFDWGKSTKNTVNHIHQGKPDKTLSTKHPFANPIPPTRPRDSDPATRPHFSDPATRPHYSGPATHPHYSDIDTDTDTDTDEDD